MRQQKEKGGYPYTHLSHHQDEEVWLNPQKLPQDIGRYVNKTCLGISFNQVLNLNLTIVR